MRTSTFRLPLIFAALLLTAACSAAPRPEPVHLIYLHGRIVQDQQSRRPEHPRHGFYELDRIAEAFRKRGFVVSAELRPKDATVSDAANGVVRQVQELLRTGVPPQRIIVVGASMGAGITLRASARLANPEVRFAVLGPCISESAVAVFNEEQKPLTGRLLSIREESDVPSATCPAYAPGNDTPRTLHVRKLVLNTGLAHGFLYRPMPEWVDPVAEWATAPAQTP
ncbi:MAG TPA: hypothetical protein VF111_00270 [Thermoanaerobaculia bacterium]